MVKGMLINWECAAALLAEINHEEQALFFKAFCKEIMTWPTVCGREKQMMYVRDLLTEEERDLLKCLCFKSSD